MTATSYWLAITDLTTTVPLTTGLGGASGSMALLDWTPTHPPVTVTKSAPIAYAGETVTGIDWGNSVDTIRLRLDNATSATLIGQVNDIQAMFRQAERRRGDPNISPIYLAWGSSGSASYRLSEIYSGRADWERDLLGSAWRADVQLVTLVVERAPYFEDTSYSTETGNPAAKPLTSGSANWFGALSGQAGDHPTPVKLSLKNTFASGSAGTVWFIHAADQRTDSSLSANIGYNRGGASVADIATVGEPTVTRSVIADGSGSAAQFVVATTSAVAAAKVTETAPAWSTLHGKPCLVMMRLSAATGYTDLYCAAKQVDGGVVVQETPTKLLSSTALWHELGYLQLPRRTGATLAAGNIQLVFTRATQPYTVKIGQVFLIPVDEYRRYETSRGMAQNEYLIDDPSLGTYIESSGSAIYAYSAIGPAVQLFPVANNWYTVIVDDTSGSGAGTRSYDVTLYAKLRTATV